MTDTSAPLVDLRMLTRYNAWANRLLHEALATMPHDVLAAPRPGPLGGVLGMLGHIHVVGLIWKGHLTGEPHGFTTRNFAEQKALADLAPLQVAQDRWYVDYAQRESDERLARTIAFSFVDGGTSRMRAADMVLHIVNHGVYHRGFIADTLYACGLKPPTTDLPVYLRDAQPH